jgi:hypothetical protein
MMHGHEKSSSAIVAVKPTNKAERSAAEPVEPRAEAEGNAGQQSTHRAQYRVRVAQALVRIRQAIAVVTRGGNRMRESCKYGSVRGAPSNGRPYRDRGTECSPFRHPFGPTADQRTDRLSLLISRGQTFVLAMGSITTNRDNNKSFAGRPELWRQRAS